MKEHPLHRYYPEVAAGGFSRVDGTVEFYQRVRALVGPASVVADIGAGRGGFLEDPIRYRRELRHLRGSVGRLIGIDVDAAVLENPAVDEALVVSPGARFPLADESVDCIVSDYTFEHVQQPSEFCTELDRILKPSGWICARTPNKWGYVGLAARAVPNHFHVAVLRRTQPSKLACDTFDVAYKLNTLRALRAQFPEQRYRHSVYTMNSEPAYFAGSRLGWQAARTMFRLVPESLGAIYFVFLQKRPR